jgi:hypothetical protein
MADIGTQLSSELTRIIYCPYPASLSVRMSPQTRLALQLAAKVSQERTRPAAYADPHC